MKYYNVKDGKRIESWCNNPESGAIEQAENLARLPFLFSHVALMPDTHQGYGMPIGGVIATENVVIPNAVGVDIGCGMRFIEANIKSSELNDDFKTEIYSRIKEDIPVGFKKHNEPQEWSMFNHCAWNDNNILGKNLENAKISLGTLGGGNHFIEMQENDKGNICFMIHSGSRNLGKQICDYYNKIAKYYNKRYYSSVPENYDLAFLAVDSINGHEYLDAMNIALKFAKENRNQMMIRIKVIFNNLFPKMKVVFEHDIHHNYVALENHYEKNVYVHRKGSTRARKDEIGIIPGSQGTSSYIVKGLGNPKSFMSCSHGAGRKMSRKKARENLNLESEIASLNKAGVKHNITKVNDLDEAPSAYKNIDIVMEEQKDLVEIIQKLKPLLVVKG